jgi:UMP-CMP kinase
MIDRITERSKTSGRADDNPETIKKRLATFTNETVPVVKEFELKGKVIKVDASKGKD